MAVIKARNYYNQIFCLTDYLVAPLLLLIRGYIAWVFIKSGLTKMNDWDSTLMLFEYEYQVPLLPFELAAYMATVGEIVLPVLLIAGLLTRLSALGISVINIVAVISLVEIAEAALMLHIFWGSLLLVNIIYGAGRLSVDNYLKLK